LLNRKFAGSAVHIFTATGAVCGLFALHFAANHNWSAVFAWLGAAAVIDGLDGPVARHLDVEKLLPRFSGARLDLVVDYLNYCVVPAFILMESGQAGEPGSVIAAIVIVLSSLFHFADIESKTKDGYFVGFPAIWNVVILYFLVFDLSPAITLVVTFVLAVLTFIPLKWVHPFRVSKWRYVTCTILLMWSLAAAYEVLANFPGENISKLVLGFSSLYLVLFSMSRSIGSQTTDAE